MTYNRADIKTRVQDKLDDTKFDSTKLNQFINDAQREILNARRFTFMEREANITTTSGSTALTGVPTTMQIPLSMKVYTPVGNATFLDYVEYEDIDQRMPNISIAGNTPPSAWTIFNLTPILVYQADGTYTLKLKYIKTPDELTTDASVPEIPEAFGELLVLGAYKRALLFNDENAKAQLVQQDIDKLTEDLDARSRRQMGTPHIMKNVNRVTRVKGF